MNTFNFYVYKRSLIQIAYLKLEEFLPFFLIITTIKMHNIMLMMITAMIIPTIVESGVELEDDDDDDPVEPDDNITKK